MLKKLFKRFKKWQFRYFMCEHTDLEKKKTKTVKINGKEREWHYKTSCKECGVTVSTSKRWVS